MQVLGETSSVQEKATQTKQHFRAVTEVACMGVNPEENQSLHGWGPP